MTIQAGQTIPTSELRMMGEKGVETVDSVDYFSNRTVVLFALPGAFTPTCSAQHLPGFVSHGDELLSRGVDAIACLSVNDAFVMNAWGKRDGSPSIDMLADGNADFVTAMGLETDSRPWGMGMRSRRFSMLIVDGVVRELFLEEPGEFRISSAEHMLSVLAERAD